MDPSTGPGPARHVRGQADGTGWGAGLAAGAAT